MTKKAPNYQFHNMVWKKLGQIYKMKSLHPLLRTHSSNPLPIFLKDDVFRIFFSGRDHINRSSVGFVDIDIISHKVIQECTQPLIKFGQDDSFYSHGISIGNAYQNEEKTYILFMGWNIPKGEHWRGDIGRLHLASKNQLTLDPEGIFMGIDNEDLISLSYPFVLKEEGIYKMWYGSTLTWKTENGEMLHVIKYATSADGNNWTKHGVAIPSALGIAQAFSRPTVIVQTNQYHMWYSYRSGSGTPYRIGYAKSIDGIQWETKHDDNVLDVSAEGWDSEMICYPFVFTHKDKIYMLYNGNNFGRDGFGLAVLQ